MSLLTSRLFVDVVTTIRGQQTRKVVTTSTKPTGEADVLTGKN
jgi:hypothetical protein